MSEIMFSRFRLGLFLESISELLPKMSKSMRFTKSAGSGLISPEAMARSTHSENFDDWEATYL